MNRPVRSVALLLTLPAVHLALCVVAGVEDGWIFLSVVDFPISFFLFGLAFRGGLPMLWFGVFGTLWWFLVSWAIRAAWRFFTERRRRAEARRSSSPKAVNGAA